MAKAKIQLTVDAVRATKSMLPLIPLPKIAPIDDGSLLPKPNDIPEEPLVSSPPKFSIHENMKHIHSVLNKPQDKGNKPIAEFTYSKTPMKERSGWSQEEINKAVEESI